MEDSDAAAVAVLQTRAKLQSQLDMLQAQYEEVLREDPTQEAVARLEEQIDALLDRLGL